jgi:CRP-like cAMP-binding protein
MKSKEQPPSISLSDIFQSLMLDYRLTESDLALIQSKFRFETVKKGGAFVEGGTRTNKIGILLDGILYARQTNSNGEEVVSRFFYSPRNIMVVSFQAFNEDFFASESIIAIEDSKLITLSKADLDSLYKEVPATNILGRLLAEDSYSKALERLTMLQCMDGEERVTSFLREGHSLENKTAAWMMASYLGMSRNNYNRIVKNIKI